MKRVARKTVTVCQTIILAMGLIFTGCSDWLNNEKEPEITIDPLWFYIEAENDLIRSIAFMKVFSFDDPYLNENEDNWIILRIFGQFPEMVLKNIELELPLTVSDGKLRKLSDYSDGGTISNPAVQVACLKYFKAFNVKSKYFGYFDWFWFNSDDESEINIQLWYADSDATYTSDDGKMNLSLRKGWNMVYEGDEIDLWNKGYRPKWRFTEL